MQRASARAQVALLIMVTLTLFPILQRTTPASYQVLPRRRALCRMLYNLHACWPVFDLQKH